MKKVYGTYTASAKARRIVDQLLEKGYKDDEIKVVSKDDLGKELTYMEDDREKDDKNLWEKIKDAFTPDQYHEKYWEEDLDRREKELLKAYKTNLENGEIIILIEEGSKAYREHFKDGVPDWDEREREFNEDLD